MFKRDLERLDDCWMRMDYCPLGACALAGTTMPIDRFATAYELGFFAPTENAMDSVSDRDYVIELLSAASISMMHISRFAEECVLWNSSEFSYIAIDDSFCTGSSIMPRVVTAGVPTLSPLVTNGDCGSLGTVFLLQVMCASSRSFSISLPVLPDFTRFTSIRWLSVPPETISTPRSMLPTAQIFSLRTKKCISGSSGR